MADAHLGAYQTVQTITADPGRLVLMLFDGAARYLGQAQRALDRGQLSAFGTAMSQAQAIVTELSDALDRRGGSEVADNLARIYDFLLRHIAQAITRRSRRHVEEVAGILRTLREGFEGAVEAPRD
jgi:flagellar protein FliS